MRLIFAIFIYISLASALFANCEDKVFSFTVKDTTGEISYP